MCLLFGLILMEGAKMDRKWSKVTPHDEVKAIFCQKNKVVSIEFFMHAYKMKVETLYMRGNQSFFFSSACTLMVAAAICI